MKKISLKAIGHTILFLLVCACICCAAFDRSQAAMAILIPLEFKGEYSVDKGETWEPYVGENDLYVDSEIVYIKGHFTQEIYPQTGVYYYNDHAAEEIYVNGECIYLSPILEVTEMGHQIYPSMCVKNWTECYSENGIKTTDEVEIRITNMHPDYNEDVFHTMMNTLYAGPMDVSFMKSYWGMVSIPGILIGGLMIVVSIMLLGITIGGIVLREQKLGLFGKYAMLSGCAGIFFLTDNISISLWSSNLMLNTYGYYLSLMLAVYISGRCIKDLLSGKKQTVVKAVVSFSGIVDAVIMICAISGIARICSMYSVWIYVQCVVCVVTLICCLMQIVENKMNSLMLLCTSVVLQIAILLDMFVKRTPVYEDERFFKLAFIFIFLSYFCYMIKNIINQFHMSEKTKLLTKELEESRIAIMRSQIQPHFLYNALVAIRELCRQDAEQARDAIGDFAVYLRGNMDSLSNKELIPFQKEMNHVQAYLKLEKMRFEDDIDIEYDIQEEDFYLPPLTLQPIVENAVKHGLGNKNGGGTLKIQTLSDKRNIIISITDDGIGFNTTILSEIDSKDHIGIQNVRKRLESIMNGEMEIQSTPGHGTVVTITIPLNKGGDV